MVNEKRPCTLNPDNSVDSALVTDLPANILPEILAWIRDNLTPSEDLCQDKTSYSLKHDLQNDTGIYMTNNQFKDAMLLCGFQAYDTDELNWKFYISPESVLFKKNKPVIKDRFKMLRTDLAAFAGKNISQAEFAKYFHIPVSTYQKWEQGVMEPPEYLYQIIDDITSYWDILWKKGIPDDVIHRDFEENLMSSEHLNNIKANSYADYRVYDEKADPDDDLHDKKDCRTMCFYPDTLFRISNGSKNVNGSTADVFEDLFEIMFKRFNTQPFVSYKELLDIMCSDTEQLNFKFSVGYDCDHKIYLPQDDNVFAILTASCHKHDGHAEFLDTLSNKRCKGIVWFCDGKRQMID